MATELESQLRQEGYTDAEARELPRPARVIANGVEAAGMSARRARHGRPRILFVGTSRPQKRARLLPAVLEALPEVELHGALAKSHLLFSTVWAAIQEISGESSHEMPAA